LRGLLALLVAASVAAPWYIAMAAKNPGYFHYYFIERHLLGYATNTQPHGGRPFWYYLPIVLGGGLPWTLYLPSALADAWQQRKSRATRSAGGVATLLVCWIVGCTLFLSLANSKLVTYIWPVFPSRRHCLPDGGTLSALRRAAVASNPCGTRQGEHSASGSVRGRGASGHGPPIGTLKTWGKLVVRAVRETAMTAYPRVEKFESATIILPVINETVSLRQTVEIILRDARADLDEILTVVCRRTTAEAMAVVEQIQAELGGLVRVHHQQLPFLGGALREGIELARGSHVIIMGSDLETDPNDVHTLIAQARAHPGAIVATSRWTAGGAFHGYSKIKLVCNWIFQHFFSFLYGTHLTDMTYSYRIMPTRLVQAIRWEELRHPFNLESIVKPLRLGVSVREIPSVWHPHMEGQSQNPFFGNFAYFRTGLTTRFVSRESLLKPLPEQTQTGALLPGQLQAHFYEEGHRNHDDLSAQRSRPEVRGDPGLGPGCRRRQENAVRLSS
jgi:hypothetical protein